MAIRGEDGGESSGEDDRYRSPKRQRLPSLDEEYGVDFEPASITEDEEEEDEGYEDEEAQTFFIAGHAYIEEEEEEEVDVTGTSIATIDNDFEDVVTEETQSGSQSSSSSSQSVKLQSSDVLDCPTCCEPLKRPIYQCNNGHLACSWCCIKLNKRCSFCRSQIGDIRCRAMEKVIEASIVPCLNAKYGCKESIMYGNQSSHEKVCVFAACSCPILYCNYIGSYMDLKSHVRAAHSSDESYLIPFVFDSSFIFGMNLSRNKRVILQEKKEGDLIVVQAFKALEGVYVTVNQIAPMAPGISNLSCSLAKSNQFSTLKIGLMVKKIQDVLQQMHPEDDVLWIPPKMLIEEHLTDGNWKMDICIGNGHKYIHI